MARWIWMIAAGLGAAAIATAAPAASIKGGGEDLRGGDADTAARAASIAAITGAWGHDSVCSGEGRLTISMADDDTLTLTLGEAAADEVIDSVDDRGAVLTHSDEGRFSYALRGEDLVITSLNDRSVETLSSCGDDEADPDAGDEPNDMDDGQGDRSKN